MDEGDFRGGASLRELCEGNLVGGGGTSLLGTLKDT